jgi:hypothetical protein
MTLRRIIPAAIAAGVVVICWYVVRFDGAPTPIGGLAVTLPDTVGSYVQPRAFEKRGEPGAVYVVPAAQPDASGLFEATRVEIRDGARTSVRIAIGPDSGYVPFLSAEVTGMPAVELRGVTIPRPTFHLFTFPSNGGGPGFHLVDSSTGVVEVVVARPSRRVVLTRTVVNSSTVRETASRLWSAPSGGLVAFLWGQPGGWTIYLLSMGLVRTFHDGTERI